MNAFLSAIAIAAAVDSYADLSGLPKEEVLTACATQTGPIYNAVLTLVIAAAD